VGTSINEELAIRSEEGQRLFDENRFWIEPVQGKHLWVPRFSPQIERFQVDCSFLHRVDVVCWHAYGEIPIFTERVDVAWDEERQTFVQFSYRLGGKQATW
jgi:hypothetical protein